MLLMVAGRLAAAEITVDDFKLDGPLGSDGAKIQRIAPNHFRMTLAHAPEHPDWANMAQFTLLRHARGNSLRMDVVFKGGNVYRYNDYFYSWSYDAQNWQPIEWSRHTKDATQGDTLEFPALAQDTIYVGHQVPMSYEEASALLDGWAKHPCAKLHVIGQSLGQRKICRLEITDPASPPPTAARWVHYFGNQHPGEHNSQWRMVGMIDWLLSPEGADCRRRSICHFVLMASPDSPSHGWYRVNAQGVDMNRAYLPGGADPQRQAHECYVVQKDLEQLMASPAPVTDLWSMHTWQGVVEPIVHPGPEIGTSLGSWTEMREIFDRNNPQNLIKPLALEKRVTERTHWATGAHQQFGITTVLCEGGGSLLTKEENLASGRSIIRAIAEYYHGLRPKP